MEIKVSGCENNRPIISTFRISDEPTAEAVADGTGWFDIEVSLDQEPEYALLDCSGQFVGMIIFFSDPHRACLSTFCNHQGVEVGGARFRLHAAIEVDKKPNY